MTTYSYSRIGNFENCPLRYKFTYLDKQDKDFQNTIESVMGSAVHSAFEELYGKLKFQKIIALEEVLEYYKEVWDKLLLDDTKIVKENVTKEDYFKMGEKYISDYYNRHHPFDDDITIGIETKVKLDLYGDGKYTLIGYIDRLAKKGNKIIVHDYKTSGSLPTKEQINDNKQLALYAMALKDMYEGEYEFELVWHYLAFDTQIRITKKEEDYKNIKEYISNKIDEIEREEEFNPKESALCSWCEYSSKCPKFAHKFKVKQMTLEEYSKDYSVNLIREYSKLKDEESKLKKKIDDLNEKIVKYADEKELDTLYSEGIRAKIFRAEGLEFPPKGSLQNEIIKREIIYNKADKYLSFDSFAFSKDYNMKLVPKELEEVIVPYSKKKKVRRVYLSKVNI